MANVNSHLQHGVLQQGETVNRIQLRCCTATKRPRPYQCGKPALSGLEPPTAVKFVNVPELSKFITRQIRSIKTLQAQPEASNVPLTPYHCTRYTHTLEERSHSHHLMWKHVDWWFQELKIFKTYQKASFANPQTPDHPGIAKSRRIAKKMLCLEFRKMETPGKISGKTSQENVNR
ncbi:unnamed protein product [Euphydryas editha]|uniref:Uncharacterized protein n=1 Tax=Euphydryas editha TaxID=104508 RepID=A0AAU9UCA6_EUPED|nr:unnamed protein product [Euphydryas editha]